MSWYTGPCFPSDYDALMGQSPTPADSAHPAGVTGAEDSYLAIYGTTEAEPRDGFVANGLCTHITLAFNGYTRAVDNGNAKTLATAVLQSAVDHAP